nr:hypothetical protein [Pseudomonas syringae pv. theae]
MGDVIAFVLRAQRCSQGPMDAEKRLEATIVLVPHAPRGNAVRDAPRHTAVLRCQLVRGSAQVTFAP